MVRKTDTSLNIIIVPKIANTLVAQVRTNTVKDRYAQNRYHDTKKRKKMSRDRSKVRQEISTNT